jgi:hypothetical protein
MSGVFRPEQNTEVAATDDADLARQHGLTQFNRATGQWEAPSAPDAGQRDGTDVPGHVDYVESSALDADDEVNDLDDEDDESDEDDEQQ